MKEFSLQPLASRLLLVALLGLASTFSGQAAYDLAALEKVEKEVQGVAEKATPCIVAITHPERRGLASGSGCVIAANGLILTAAHVVGDAKMVNVVFADHKLVHARVLGADYHRDVALAMIAEPGDYPFMELGDTTTLGIGDMVVALGHPGGFDPQRKPPVRFGRVFEFDHNRYIRTDCTLAGGDSGGPLFDLSGRVVGVHSSVGTDLSVNNDVPAEAVRADWDRLMRGDHWGQNDGPLGPKLSKKELNGLDLEAFRELVLKEEIKSNGRLTSTPEMIAKWLVQCGMKPEKVKELRPAELADFVAKVFGGAKASSGRPDGPKEPSSSPFTDEELAGLDLEKFRARVIGSAMQSGGHLQTNPKEIAGWLRECGMKEERVKSLGVNGLAQFVQKTLGGRATTTETVRFTSEELAGLDLEKFRKRVEDEAAKSQGRINAAPGVIAGWLRDCGMQEAHAKAMSPEAVNAFVQKVQRATLAKAGATADSGAPHSAAADNEFPGLDMDKFRALVLREAMKQGGSIAATPDKIQKWLKESGMKEDKASAVGPERMTGLLEKALGSGMVEEDRQPEAIVEQDKEVFEAVKPGIDKIAPSMVALMDGNKTLALGTIVRENGFILTKHTEIAKAKALKVRLPDGRTLPAREVQEFAGHDLALVKTAAEGLHAASIPGAPQAIHLGSLVFSPGVSREEPVVGQGIVSLMDRSLKQGGGYLGIAMNEVEDVIEVTEVLPASPADKAGLRKSDRIVAVNDIPLRTTQEVSDYIRTQAPDSTVRVKLRRGTEEKIIGVKLGDRARLAARPRPDDPMSSLGTEVSARHSGFPMVFQHDQPLRPSDCGGVIVNIHGEVVGVNVARANRVETYAVPASVVADLLKGVDFRALAR